MVHNLDREDFILSHFDLLERANLGRVAGDAEKQMFFDVMHWGLEEARLEGSLLPGFCAFAARGL